MSDEIEGPSLREEPERGGHTPLRLMALLSELVRDKGIMRAAQELDVDHRTLGAGLESGRLSRRMRGALEKALLEGGGSPAAEQRERNDALEGRVKTVEGRVDELGKDMTKGLAAVQGEVKALRDEHDRGMRRLAQLESGGALRKGRHPAQPASRRGGPRCGGSFPAWRPLSLPTTRRCSGTPGC